MYEHLGERFEAERVRLGLSRSEVAAQAGVTGEQVRRIERGESKPGADILAGLTSYGADITFVLTGRRAVALDPQRLAQICHAIEAAVDESLRVKGHCSPRVLGLIYNQVLAKGRSSDDDVELAKAEVAQFLESLRALDIPDTQLAERILRQPSEPRKGISVSGSGNQVAGGNLSGTQINIGTKK